MVNPKTKSRSKKRSTSKRSRGDDALYAFYYSLYLEDPSNKMARNWLIDNGYMNRFNVQSLSSELDEIEQSMFPSQRIKRRTVKSKRISKRSVRRSKRLKSKRRKSKK
jgi:hypothetical protein